MEQVTIADFIRDGLCEKLDNGELNVWIAGYAEKGKVERIDIETVEFRTSTGYTVRSAKPYIVLSVEHKPTPAQAPAADANGAAGEGLRIGQLVRYTSKQSNEIAYGAFGVVKAVDMLTGWYDVLFFDYEGLRAINGIVLQSVLPENCNRAEAENDRLRSELEAARVENDLRGEFLRRVVAIRTELIDDRSNSWLDSIDAIREYIGGLTRRLQLVDHQISNMIFNLKQNPDTESIVRALEYIAEFAKVDKS